MRWNFTAAAPATTRARAAARAFAAEAGADADTLAAVALCVSEAVSNAVVHAYRDSERPGLIEVEVEVERPNGCLCLLVRDHGCGLWPRIDSPGLGLGFPLIAQCAGSLEVRRARGGGTEVRMRFDLHAATYTAG